MARPEIVTGEIYHVYNRGVEKRNVFLDDDDHFRFIFSLYECNDAREVVMRDRIGERLLRNSKFSIGSTYGKLSPRPDARKQLVDILAFCLMPNHYHLVLRQSRPNGIALFMKKVSNSYTGYFNGKHTRKGMGALFQGRYKLVHVGADQLLHLAEYVFSNPIKIIEPEWKSGKVRNYKKAINFLNNYKWSSYLDCIGIKNFPSVTQRDFLHLSFAGTANIGQGQSAIKKSIENWIKGQV